MCGNRADSRWHNSSRRCLLRGSNKHWRRDFRTGQPCIFVSAALGGQPVGILRGSNKPCLRTALFCHHGPAVGRGCFMLRWQGKFICRVESLLRFQAGMIRRHLAGNITRAVHRQAHSQGISRLRP